MDAKYTSVSLIGLGPRGLCVLERLLAVCTLPHNRDRRVAINIIEPGTPGAGVHSADQPDFFLLNTVAGLPTVVPGEPFIESRLPAAESSFLKWLRPEQVLATDYVPRKVFGEYCTDVYRRLVADLPKNVSVSEYKDMAIAIGRGSEDNCEEVTLRGGLRLASNYVVLCLGHSDGAQTSSAVQPRLITNIYREGGRLAELGPEDRVGVEGFGLTAMDAISALTAGRGGRFCRDGGHCRYVPSGQEPTLFLYSRLGLPYRSRPRFDDGEFGYRPVVLTSSVAREYRSGRMDGDGDFEADILPLVMLEMKVAYYCACSARRVPYVSGYDPEFQPPLLDREHLHRWLAEREAQFGVIDIRELLWPRLSLSDPESYQQSIRALLEQDLCEARRGLADSPCKVALEVLLSLREAMRVVVGHGGLSATSHEWFFDAMASTINRNVIGPQLDRNEELAALIEAGIVRLPFGPDPQVKWISTRGCWVVRSNRLGAPFEANLSWRIAARSPQMRAALGNSQLLVSLARARRIRTSRADSAVGPGIAVNRRSQVLDECGVAQPTLLASGPLCEGSTYYNAYVPTRIGQSTPFVEAEAIATQILEC